ncbi:MAG: S8/S53 family peptidase [Candidatus Eremiobacteraeota bacterium]|nr:S8/S53 family peptidase [Candidatus Eremiobacteraeota bacterium]
MLALSLLFALAACQGASGGLSAGNALPPTGSPSTRGGETRAQEFSLLRDAPRGIRTYVHLPLRNSAQLDRLIQEQSSKDSPMFHHFLTVAQFRAAYGPRLTDLQRTAQLLEAEGFKTTITSQGVIADAPAATVERVFRIHLRRTKSALLRGPGSLLADRAPMIPRGLASVGAQVAALAPIRPMQPQIAMVSKTPLARQNRFGPNKPFYWFDDLKQAYTYPSYTIANGAGRTTALVAASDFQDSDLAMYLSSELLAPPTIVRRIVDGKTQPFSFSDGYSIEVSLDVQQQAGSAPGARIVVYEAPDGSTASFIDMFTTIDEDNVADVVGNSFGLCELLYLPSYNNGQNFTYLLQIFHDLFRQGNAQGITFVEGSGDNGAQGGQCTDTTGKNAVFGVVAFADDPNVTGVGGTNLQTSSIPGSLQSTYVSENANFDTFINGFGFAKGAIWGSGGGKSVIWPRPLYQYFVNTGAFTRAVPDVSMMMGGCPLGAASPCGLNPLPSRSAFVTVLAGVPFALIGTSGSNQEFAGLQAVQDQALGGRAGNANYLIYGLAALSSFGFFQVFHNNIPGNNGYPSHQGYNFVVGNGTPYGSRYALMPFVPVAGNPQTPSNP